MTKAARRWAHDYLDEYRRMRGLSKNGGYRHLCKLMDMDRHDGHIGRFTAADCIRLCTLLTEVHPELIIAVRVRREALALWS